jgi:hypothetical protein
MAAKRFRKDVVAAGLTCPAVVVLALSLVAAPKLSDWSAPVNLGATVNSPFAEFGPAISRDGLSLYFASNRPTDPDDLVQEANIWVAQRPTGDSPWGAPVLVPVINTTAFVENVPALSRDGHWLFFNSNRPGGFGDVDIWASFRFHTHDDLGWQSPINLGPGVNSEFFDAGASFFENDDGGVPLLFFGSSRPGGPGGVDIYVSQQMADGSFGGASLVAELSSPQEDQRPAIRFDGLELFLFSNRVGTFGGADVWASTRNTVAEPWSAPENLGPTINTTSNDQQAYIASDRETLFFTSNRPGGFGNLDLYVTTRTKIKGP